MMLPPRRNVVLSCTDYDKIVSLQIVGWHLQQCHLFGCKHGHTRAPRHLLENQQDIELRTTLSFIMGENCLNEANPVTHAERDDVIVKIVRGIM